MFDSLDFLWYLERLRFQSTNERERAAEVLGQLGDPRAVDPLIRALVDSDKSVRKRAAQALVQLGEPKWAELVTGCDKDFKRLGESDDPRVVDPLIHALVDSDKSVRYIAARILGQLGDLRAVNPLIHALVDSEGSVRGSAAVALRQLGDPRAVDPLIHALRDSEDSVRIWATEALGQLDDLRAVDPLIHALGDYEDSVRGSAAWALCQLGEPKWAEWVTGCEQDFERLGGSGDPRVVDPLIHALGYSDEWASGQTSEAQGNPTIRMQTIGWATYS